LCRASKGHALPASGKPGIAVTAILTLTIGIGVSTAIFAVLDAVLLEPLPFATVCIAIAKGHRFSQ
jgi:hypothetical protein